MKETTEHPREGDNRAPDYDQAVFIVLFTSSLLPLYETFGECENSEPTGLGAEQTHLRCMCFRPGAALWAPEGAGGPAQVIPSFVSRATVQT